MKFKGFCAGLLLCVSAAPAMAQMNVVTSIKPLQLITQAVMGDLGQASVLIPPGASPHHYALKPSDRRALAKAELVVWIGPDLELFLEKVLENSKAEVLTLLPEDEHAGETAEEHAAHVEESEGDDHHGHNHGGVDPHLWLSPMEALRAAEQVSAKLAARYPEHKEQLARNLSEFSAELVRTDRQLQADLKPLQNKGFFVFHDAYDRFMDRYQLNMLGAFTVDPGRPVGTRHLSDIRAQLVADKAVCVFGEPQFKAAVVKSITEDLPVGYGELDPLALGVEVSTKGYTQYLRQLGDQVRSCLAGKGLAAR